jgi:hypothetical protein
MLKQCSTPNGMLPLSELSIYVSDQNLVLDVLWHLVDNQAAIVRHASKQVRILTAPSQAIDTVLMVIITVHFAIHLLPAQQNNHITSMALHAPALKLASQAAIF